jgi:hypothetical protein
MPMNAPEVIDVLTSMHGGQCAVDHVVAVEMEMQDVEIVRTFPHLGQHREMGRNVPRQLVCVYRDLVYQPMTELLDYLRANEFKNFIVSGTGADFIRVFAEETYRIPSEQVMGSTTVTEFRLGETGPVLMKIPDVEVLRDGPGKPVAIDRFIGQRPIFAFGNSDGDKEMLQWTAAGSGARFVGLLHHTDAEREWAYDRASKVGSLDEALDLAHTRDWTIVDMKKDWKIVFPKENANS